MLDYHIVSETGSMHMKFQATHSMTARLSGRFWGGGGTVNGASAEGSGRRPAPFGASGRWSRARRRRAQGSGLSRGVPSWVGFGCLGFGSVGLAISREVAWSQTGLEECIGAAIAWQTTGERQRCNHPLPIPQLLLSLNSTFDTIFILTS